MHMEPDRIARFHQITQMMLRHAQNQHWIELWALQHERDKLLPSGLKSIKSIKGIKDNQSREIAQALHRVRELEEQITIALQDATAECGLPPCSALEH